MNNPNPYSAPIPPSEPAAPEQPVEAAPETDATATKDPWLGTPEQADPPSVANLNLTILVAAAALSAGVEQVGQPKEEEVFEKPWSRPMGLDGDNRMLRFLYLDEQIGWVYRIPNDSWHTGRATTDLEDAGPAEKVAQERRKLAIPRKHEPLTNAPTPTPDGSV